MPDVSIAMFQTKNTTVAQCARNMRGVGHWGMHVGVFVCVVLKVKSCDLIGHMCVLRGAHHVQGVDH